METGHTPGRVDLLEKEMNEVKIKLGRLNQMERAMEFLTQGFDRILAVLEDTKNSVQSVRKSPDHETSSEKDKPKEASKEKTVIFESKLTSKQRKAMRNVPTQAEMIREWYMLDDQYIDLPSYPNLCSSKKIMKIKGKIKGRDVVVLIKPDTTHNFVSEKLVKELQLPKSDTRDYVVVMDDGIAYEGDNVCLYVSLALPGMNEMEHCLPFELTEGVDVILGSKWLRNLEDVMIYYEDGTTKMKIKQGNDTIEWTTDLNL